MLSGKRAPVTDDQIGGTFDELSVIANSRFAFQIETDAHVDAAVSEMSVERGVIIVFVQQFADIAEVSAQFFRCNGRVVPSLPFWRRARGCGSRARSGLAQLPYVAGLALGVQTDSRGIGRFLQLLDQSSGAILRLARSVGSKFHQQNAPPLRNELEVGGFLLF